MITSSFSLENFRTFRSPTNLELAPITILTGPNSSGKSSILKALLLLKESAKRHGLTRLDFAGGGHNLGSFEAVRTHGSDKQDLRFGLSLPSVTRTARGKSISSLDSPPSEYLLPVPATQANGHVESITTHVQVQVTFSPDRGRLSRVDIRAGEPGEFETVLSVFHGRGEYDWESPKQQVNGKLDVDDVPTGYVGILVNGPWVDAQIDARTDVFADRTGWDEEDPDRKALRAALSSPVTFIDYGSVRLTELSSLFKGGVRVDEERTGTLETEAFEIYDIIFREVLYPFVKRTTRALLGTFQSEKITHLSALREGVNQIYLEESTPSGFTRLLRKAVDNKSLLRDKQEWLSVFNIGDQINVERVADAGYVVSARRDGRDHPISSLGFGVSQILPLIMYLQLENASDTSQLLLLEEPEANLHPNLQARLADLFADLAVPGNSEEGGNEWEEKWGGTQSDSVRQRTSLLVETHSEYLIRRLQYLVATGEISTSDVRIYYLGPDPESEDYIRRIEVDADGQLSQSFGPGFFDEATNLMTDLYREGQKQ